jgi:NADPH-dependent 2,4-dienoyl-CoA reductase/sulfur reductase-like enzyme/rhodanese-related sulfurtransferase
VAIALYATAWCNIFLSRGEGMAKKIVIIGGVSIGPKAAARARRRDPGAEITILEKGEALSYAGCGTPYYIAGKIHDYKELMMTPAGIVRDTAFFKNVKAIRVCNKTMAERIDRAGKVVQAVNVDTGERFEFPYDQLVVATGSMPVRPPLPGIDLQGVHVLSNLEEAVAIRKEMESGKRRVVIVGAGLIGMEVAEAFAERGAEITMVELKDQVLPALLDKEMAILVEKHLAAKKVAVRTGVTVQGFTGDGQGRVAQVATNHGDLPADLVLIAVGVKPNTRLAREAGLAIGPLGGIVVDERLRTSDPDIFAGGDCVENQHLLTGEPIYVPIGSTANKHGRVIGDNLTGGSTRYPGILGSTILKIFDYNVGATGLTERAARERGFDAVTTLTPGPDKAHYYPGAKLLVLKGVADRKTGTLLGVQAAGPGEASKRIDVAAMAISQRMTLGEIALADVCYAPPYAGAMDNLVHLATALENQVTGLAVSRSPLQVKRMIDDGEDFLLLDVRTPAEHMDVRIADPRHHFIPLGKLRERLGELPRDKEVIAYCKTSLRGYEAMRILKGAGFEKASYLGGGVAAWPFALVKG